MPGWGPIGQYAVGELPASQPTGGAFSSFSTPSIKTRVSIAVLTAGVAFTPAPPAKAAPIFTQFSQPVRKSVQQTPWWFSLAPITTRTAIFSSFSRPQFIRSVIPDEQPSALFEILPPAARPFTGFAEFSQPLRASKIAWLSGGFKQFIFALPVDTHDLVFIGDPFRKKKRIKDPIDLELERKAKLRADIELAIYGPAVTYEPLAAPLIPPVAAAPPNIEGLTRAIMQARQAQEQAKHAAIAQDDEDIIEMILRDL